MDKDGTSEDDDDSNILHHKDPSDAARAKMVGAGKAIEAAFPGDGFALFVMTRGEGGGTELRYVSNINRLDLAKVLEDFAYRVKVKIN